MAISSYPLSCFLHNPSFLNFIFKFLNFIKIVYFWKQFKVFVKLEKREKEREEKENFKRKNKKKREKENDPNQQQKAEKKGMREGNQDVTMLVWVPTLVDIFKLGPNPTLLTFEKQKVCKHWCLWRHNVSYFSLAFCSKSSYSLSSRTEPWLHWWDPSSVSTRNQLDWEFCRTLINILERTWGGIHTVGLW